MHQLHHYVWLWYSRFFRSKRVLWNSFKIIYDKSVKAWILSDCPFRTWDLITTFWSRCATRVSSSIKATLMAFHRCDMQSRLCGISLAENSHIVMRILQVENQEDYFEKELTLCCRLWELVGPERRNYDRVTGWSD